MDLTPSFLHCFKYFRSTKLDHKQINFSKSMTTTILLSLSFQIYDYNVYVSLSWLIYHYKTCVSSLMPVYDHDLCVCVSLKSFALSTSNKLKQYIAYGNQTVHKLWSYWLARWVRDAVRNKRHFTPWLWQKWIISNRRCAVECRKFCSTGKEQRLKDSGGFHAPTSHVTAAKKGDFPWMLI